MQTLEIFWRFLLLGLTSFGGPTAHIGYFRLAFVEKLRWLDEAEFARTLALCQLLPGPASSQLGFAIGLARAGLLGGIAAFVGFTLPSMLLMIALALFASGEGTLLDGAIWGLKLFAVAVVLDALIGMSKSFASTPRTRAITLLSASALWLFEGVAAQMGVLLLAALFGAYTMPREGDAARAKQGRIGWMALGLFVLVWAALPFVSDLAASFYSAGSLVFGGGHVVLPLLEQSVGAQVGADRFMLGYASAQAVPGPMFSFATFLGAELSPDAPIIGALMATLAIFAPGFLLILAFRGAWERLLALPRLGGALGAINAAVVGILLAALYDPIFISAVHSGFELSIAVLGYLLLSSKKVPIVLLVLLFALFGILAYM